MLPYLNKYKTSSPRIANRGYVGLLLESDTVREHFDDAIAAIQKGEVIE
jgi:hypothetical protein